jgi:signal transduction histidine kinase
VRLRLLDTGTEDELTVVFVEDMTRSREQAQQLKLAALGRLTANIAHEIRNPLSAISHASELLAEERREQDRSRLTRIIQDNTLRLERLVADVLQLNRRDRVAAERIGLHAWLRAFLEEFVANESIPADRIVVEPSPMPGSNSTASTCGRWCGTCCATPCVTRAPGPARATRGARVRRQSRIERHRQRAGRAKGHPGAVVRTLLHHRQQGHGPRTVPGA